MLRLATLVILCTLKGIPGINKQFQVLSNNYNCLPNSAPSTLLQQNTYQKTNYFCWPAHHFICFWTHVQRKSFVETLLRPLATKMYWTLSVKITSKKKIQLILCYGRSLLSFRKELSISDWPRNAFEQTNWNILQQHKQFFSKKISQLESYQNLSLITLIRRLNDCLQS